MFNFWKKIVLDSLKILYAITKTANIPAGCVLKDSDKFPLNTHDIECARPQPGQKGKCIALMGHSEKSWFSGDIIAIEDIAIIQKTSSKYL